MAEAKKTIQDQLDYCLSPANGSTRTVKIVGCDGPCEIPDYVNVQFYSCNFESLKTSNNNLFFRDCTFKKDFTNFNLRSSACIFENCTFNTKVTFNSSKVEFINCKVNQSIFIQNKASLKSKGTVWASNDGQFNKIGLFVLKGRVESVKDTWGKWEEFSVKAQTNSFVNIVNPVKVDNYATFVYLKKNSTCEVWDYGEIKNTKEDFPLFWIEASSKLETFNVTSFNSAATFLKSKGSVIKLHKVSSIQVKNILADAEDSNISIECETVKSTAAGSMLKLLRSKCAITNLVTAESKEIFTTAEASSLDIIGKSKQAKITSSDKEAFNLKSSSVFAKVLDNITSTSGYVVTAVQNSKIFFYDIKEVKTTASDKECILTDQSIFNAINVTSILSNQKSTVRCDSASRLQILNVQNIKMSNSGDTSQAAITVGNNSYALVTNITNLEGSHVFKVGDFSKVTVKNVVSGKALLSSGNAIEVGNNAVVNLANCNTLEGKQYFINTAGVGNKIKLKNMKNMLSTKGTKLNESTLDIDNSGSSSESKVTGTEMLLTNARSTGSYSFNCLGPIKLNTIINATNFDIDLKGVSGINQIKLTNSVINGKFIACGSFTAAQTNVLITNSTLGATDLSELSIAKFSLSTLDKLNSRKSLVVSEGVKVNQNVDLSAYSSFVADYINAPNIIAKGSSLKVANVKTSTIDLNQGEDVLLGLNLLNTRVITKSHGNSNHYATSAFVDTYYSMFISANNMYEVKAETNKNNFTSFSNITTGAYYLVDSEDTITMRAKNKYWAESETSDMALIAKTLMYIQGATITENAITGSMTMSSPSVITVSVGGSILTVDTAQINVTQPFNVG